jgi:hypothetical protein
MAAKKFSSSSWRRLPVDLIWADHLLRQCGGEMAEVLGVCATKKVALAFVLE